MSEKIFMPQYVNSLNKDIPSTYRDFMGDIRFQGATQISPFQGSRVSLF